MKRILLFVVAAFILLCKPINAAVVYVDLSDPVNYSLTNLTASYDDGILTLNLDNSGSQGVFTLEQIAEISDLGSLTFGYDQDGLAGNVIYKAGDGQEYHPYGTQKATVTIPGAGSPASTIGSGKFTITIAADTELPVKINNLYGIEKVDPIPEGWASLYPHTYLQDGVPENKVELAPALVQPNTTFQLIGPANGWGEASKNYVDLSDYDSLIVKLSFNPEDIGKECFFRYSYATAVDTHTTKAEIIVVPETSDYTFEIDLNDYAFVNDLDVKSYLGGLIFYTSTHFSVGVTAEDLVKGPVLIEYVALKINQDVPVTGVSLDIKSLDLKKMTTVTLPYTVSPETAYNKNVNFESDDESVVTVDAFGKLTPVDNGTAWITITTEDGEFTDVCEVTVVDVETIPEGWVSLYPHTYIQGGVPENKVELAPVLVQPSTTIQLIGNSNGWGDASVNYVDLSYCDSLIVKLSFNPADIGKECFFRYSYATAVDAHTNKAEIIVVPETLDYTFEIDLNDYAFVNDLDVKSYLGGLIFYTSTHFSVGVTAEDLVKGPVLIEYVALKEKEGELPPNAVINPSIDDPDAIINVYSITGTILRHQVKMSEAIESLPNGVYIFGTRKMVVVK